MSDDFAKALSSGFADVKSIREEKSFAELFESYDTGMSEDIQIGDKIRGEIISIGTDTVFVNTGTKIDGAVEKAELLDENGEFPYEKGDALELYVISRSESEIRLSKALSGIGGLNLLREAFQNKIPVEGKVTEKCKGGFHVEIIQRKAFCPISQIDLKFVESPDEYIGKQYQFLITQIEEEGKNIIVSRRALLFNEQEKAKKKFLESINVGDTLEGRVTNIMPYGAFVELFPGVEGMVHISELSWTRVEKTDDVLKVGDVVKVKITELEPDQKSGMKIALSIKDITEDPWLSVTEKFHIGDKVSGKVKQCANFGAFVEIEPGIEGLVHISEMSYKKRVLKPEDVVKPGETVDVMIKEIDLEKKRISLSIKDAEGDPWIDVQKKYKVGQSLEGILEKKEKFGYFVKLEPGITGLLPKSKISKSAHPGLIEKLKEGDTIPIIIEEIKPRERKITLSPTDTSDEDDWRKYTKDKKKSTMGTFGEKLQKALKSKDI